MSDVCVVVMDAARARFFSLEGHAERGVKGGPDLVEHEALVNPNATLKDSEKYSDSKLFRAPSTGATAAMHGHDDSHARHDAEDNRRFARRIADEVVKLVDQQNASSGSARGRGEDARHVAAGHATDDQVRRQGAE